MRASVPYLRKTALFTSPILLPFPLWAIIYAYYYFLLAGAAACKDLVNKMRAADVDKAGPNDYRLDWGNKVTGTSDNSKNGLFVYVNETLYQRPVYANFIAVIQKNLFTADVCKTEASMSGFRKSQIQLLFDTWTSTQVFNLAFQFLKGNGFEHVFLGEWRDQIVDGQHSWVRYYNLQKADKINYHGYYSYVVNLTGTFQYTWESQLKKIGGFLIGTSPAFDFSLFTVCVLTYPGEAACRYSIDGHPLAVTSFTQSCDVEEEQI
ncbi:endoribonuclease XendoU [Ancylostoma duodenale]|uniref:Endoribonuclease XendoU n=1 Tax=Ancylostoma duodenale TaxID=51022 RepID=A0A0C2CXI8_9BILA|nr:endoribonuclease XendoU [Ancylostoma duodenale]